MSTISSQEVISIVKGEMRITMLMQAEFVKPDL